MRSLLIILAFCACQSRPAPPERGSADPAVVMVRIINSNGDAGHCTGVVVAPHLVLTAAHCLARQTVGDHPDISIYRGGDADDPVRARRVSHQAAVAATAYDPAFNINRLRAGHDIGLVMTSAPIGVTPLGVNTAELGRIHSARLVGYGITDPEIAGNKGGLRRSLPVRFHAIRERFIELEDSAPRPCAGDSGGPILARFDEGGPEVVVGIISYGDTGCRREPLVTNLAAYSSYFRDFLARDSVVARGN